MPAGEFTAYGVITSDGLVRVDVVGSDPANPVAESQQFIGALDASGVGSGVVVGEGCASGPLGRFCGVAAPAQINGLLSSTSLRGSIALRGVVQVTTSGGEEIWSLDGLLQSGVGGNSDKDVSTDGLWKVFLAEFAQDKDVIMSIDAAGRLFFQSPSAGCTGNGTLATRVGGQINIYDVSLVIGSCDSVYASLNGSFEGLAMQILDYWDDYDTLNLWLSQPSGDPSPVALTFSAEFSSQ
ncbi:MAG: hypothetical protein ABI640_08710 [Gammaproteobacteria bacterium]